MHIVINGSRLSFRTRSCLFLSALALLLSACTQQPQYPAPAITDHDISIDISSLQPEVPVFYTYLYKGKKISFFVLKIHDTISAFLDACVTCHPHRKGYRYDDGSVTCRYCNMKFSVYKLEKGIGGCYPIKIEGHLEKGRYHIAIKTLEEAADKF